MGVLNDAIDADAIQIVESATLLLKKWVAAQNAPETNTRPATAAVDRRTTRVPASRAERPHSAPQSQSQSQRVAGVSQTADRMTLENEHAVVQKTRGQMMKKASAETSGTVGRLFVAESNSGNTRSKQLNEAMAAAAAAIARTQRAALTGKAR